MTYRVVYTAHVRAKIAVQVDYLRGQAVADETIEDWFTRLFDAIDNLYKWPKRCPIAKDQTEEEGFEVHKLIFADYLIFYRIDDHNHIVEVLDFAHGAQQHG
jgi:mRNA-degrading endonuclease RelE of RelBE toxin-antitoxin system